MATRLEHEPATQVVEVLTRPRALRHDGVAGYRFDAVRDDAQRLTRGVRVDDAHAAPALRRMPVSTAREVHAPQGYRPVAILTPARGGQDRRRRAFRELVARIERCAARRFEAGWRSFVSPFAVRVLFTVAAAIRSAVSSERPRLFTSLLMCSYWRSRFAVHAFCGMCHLPDCVG
jgi:hypothetical protein